MGIQLFRSSSGDFICGGTDMTMAPYLWGGLFTNPSVMIQFGTGVGIFSRAQLPSAVGQYSVTTDRPMVKGCREH